MVRTTPEPRKMAQMDPTFEEEGDLQFGNPQPTKERIQRKVKLPSEPMHERENESADELNRVQLASVLAAELDQLRMLSGRMQPAIYTRLIWKLKKN